MNKTTEQENDTGVAIPDERFVIRGTSSFAHNKGKQYGTYRCKYIKPAELESYDTIKGWWVRAKWIGTHGEFLAWNPHSCETLWEEDPATNQKDGCSEWVQIREDWPLVCSV